jgi:hypothetical protein
MADKPAGAGTADFRQDAGGDEIFHGSAPYIAEAARGDGHKQDQRGKDDP